MRGERETRVLAPPQCVTQQNRPASILPGFPSQAFPTAVASLRSPRAISPQSTAELARNCLLISMLQLPATEFSRGVVSLSRVCMAAAKIECVIPFRLSQISCLTLQQPQMLHLYPKQMPQCGDLTPASPPPTVQIQSYSLSSSLSSFLCLAKFCVVLYTLFWWSSPLVRSQMVFCKIFCVWRCIPDASMERDVLHICLLLCHLRSPNCCFLTHIQVSQETGKMVWYSHLFKSFPQFVMIHAIKGFSIVNEREVDVFLEFP